MTMDTKTRLFSLFKCALKVVLPTVLIVHLGCSGERDPATLFGPAERETVVVDAVLYVDRPLPVIFITRTLEANMEFVEVASAVNDAEVTVVQGLAEYRYESVGHLGRYAPPPGAPMVRPDTEYRLRVRALGREIRGVTKTPGRISLKEIVIVEESTMEVIGRLESERTGGNQVVYREGIIEVRFDPLDVEAYQVVVLDREADDEDSSPPLEALDGRLLLPWFAIGPSGEHDIEVYALDRNLFDFLRSVEASGQNAFGFGSLAGDTFERPVFNLDGGIGVFGSASVVSFGFVVVPDG